MELRLLRSLYKTGTTPDPVLRVVVNALRLSANRLAHDPRELAGQLVGRLARIDEVEVIALRESALRWRCPEGWWCPVGGSGTLPPLPQRRTGGEHDCGSSINLHGEAGHEKDERHPDTPHTRQRACPM